MTGGEATAAVAMLKDIAVEIAAGERAFVEVEKGKERKKDVLTEKLTYSVEVKRLGEVLRIGS